MKIIRVERRMLAANEEDARELRRGFQAAGVRVFNLLGAPGSGKTALLEATLRAAGPAHRMAVVEGDVATAYDAKRIAATGTPVVQIETHGACHLTAAMVRAALVKLPLDSPRVLFIENVGNLVCPSSFDLGETAKVVVVSVAEGEEKPEKYPAAFLAAEAVVISKLDLARACGCSVKRLKANALKVNPVLRVFITSAKTGQGLKPWLAYLAGDRGEAW
jgi:hydrogenase nickel incorporation protein HypB